MSPYEQVLQQRKFARAQRRFHGQATELDDAEDRYAAILGRVWAMRRRPLLLIPLVAFVLEADPYPAAGGGVAAVCLALWIGNGLGDLGNWMSGAFRPRIRFEIDTGVMIAFGVLAISVGAAAQSAGVIITGSAMVVWSAAWRPWARWVLRRTDYEHLRSEPPKPSGPSYIME